MAMTVSCPSCSTTLRIGEENAGKKMRCPSCQKIFKAPTADEADDPDRQDETPVEKVAPKNLELDDEPPPPRRDPDPPRRSDRDEDDRGRDEDDRPRRSRRDEDEDEDDRPRRSRRDDDYDDRPRRSRRRDDDDYDDRPRRGSSGGADPAPMVLGIISLCTFWCFPVGVILGLIGFLIASSALSSMPRGAAAREERRSLETGKLLCTIGMIVQGVLFVIGCLFRLLVAGAAASRF